MTAAQTMRATYAHPQPRQKHTNRECQRSFPAANALPSQQTVQDCSNVLVYDNAGRPRPFGTIYAGKPGRHLIIFVRHFFCGMCQDYLRALNTYISPEELLSLPIPTTLTIIGCGQPDLIDDYVSHTSNRFPILADPNRDLYNLLSLGCSMDAGPYRPEYQTTGIASLVAKSIYQGIASGSGATRGGNFSQVGGEFLFENEKVSWCHRMRNTRDHTEISEIRSRLGLP